MRFLSYIAGLFLLTLASCQTDPNIPASPEVRFETDIQPILTGNCGQSNCHAKDGHNGSLIGYDNVISTGQVKAGNARGSELYRVISNRSFNEMPPKPQALLNSTDIKLIYVWIEQGAKNN